MLQNLIDLVIPAMNFVLLTAVGLALTPGDFARVRREWAVVLFGLVAPLIILPPLALGLVWWFQPSAEVTASLLLVAACPIGGISNTYSYLAKASTALSVTLTALSCVLAIVAIPVLGKGFEWALDERLGLTAPIPLLVGELVLVLGLPVLVGMWLRRRAPHVAEHHAPALRRVAFVGTGLVLLLIIVEAPGAFVVGLSTMVPLAALFVSSSIAAGWWTSALVTREPKDRFTLAAEFGTRNVGVAIAIAVTLLGRVGFARFAVTYVFVEIPLMLVAVALFRHRQARDYGAARLANRTAPVRDS